MNEPPLVQIRGSLRSDGARVAIQPADVHGRWTTRRNIVFALLILVYVALPWIPIGGHPAVFIDLSSRRFYLFGGMFNAQDTWLMIFVVGGALVSIVAITAVLGRVWCGWACPQTVFLEGVFRKIERWIEGPREARRRGVALWRKLLVHALYALTAAALAHVFLAYFVSLPGLFSMMRTTPTAHLEAFLLVFGLAAILYFDFAWFREQFCVVMCPYGRLQSVLLDSSSLVVGYDKKRGEPRGKVKDPGRGACVDCNRCVVVCPTGIDIREGLQMDCLACTACIDACDEIMDKTGQPRGLIRYDSQAALDGGKTRFLRWRLGLYAAVLLAGAVGAFFAFSGRETLGVNVLRQPGMPFVVEGERVRNGFELHVVNKRPDKAILRIEAVDAPAGQELVTPLPTFELAPLEQARVPVFVFRPRGAAGPVKFRVVDDKGAARTVSAAFLGT